MEYNGVLPILFRGTLQDFAETALAKRWGLGSEDILLIFNDSHYYFDEEDIRCWQANYLIIGNEYTSHPGRYLYPNYEGSFTVTANEGNKSYILSAPNSAGHSYNHKNVKVLSEKSF